MISFRNFRGSDSFYGDVGDVRVAARRDSCKRETHRLMQLAQQVSGTRTSNILRSLNIRSFFTSKVLLLDQQKTELSAFPDNPDVEERSFLFHLQPNNNSSNNNNNNNNLIRVTLRALLTGVTAHHILLQLVGTVLLQGTKHVVQRYESATQFDILDENCILYVLSVWPTCWCTARCFL